MRKAIHGINPMYKFMPTINGYPYQLPYFLGNPMGFDLYRTKDGRFFLPTGAYPRLLNSMCTFLGCSPDKDSIANAVAKWDSAELDEAAAEKDLVFAVIRTAEEWAAHPQGKQLAEKPLVEIVKIGDSDPEPFTPAARPLSGLRVLSATHVIAGNVMSRTLAEHGAEVLQIAHPEEFEHEALMLDPCAGFTSSAWLDLNQPDGFSQPRELVMADGHVPAAHAVDVTGRVRALLYGPYISVPPGNWTAEIVLGTLMAVVLILRPSGITGGREFSLPRRRRPVADLEKARATT